MSAELALAHQIKPYGMRVINEQSYDMKIHLDVTEDIESKVSYDSTGVFDVFEDGSSLALFNLNSDTNDLGNTYNATPVNITYQQGVYDNCAYFNGSAYATAPRIPIDQTFSISLWAMKTANHDGWIINQRGGTDGVDKEWQIMSYSPNGIVFVLWDTTGTAYYAAFDFAYVGEIGVWKHLAVTVGGGFIESYTDGILSNTTPFTGTLPTAAPRLRIGAGAWDVTPTSYFWRGRIDQVRIFNKALTADEVFKLFRERHSLKQIIVNTIDVNDIFNDDSCLTTLSLDGDSHSMREAYSCVPSGITYTRGKFGLAAKFAGSSSSFLDFGDNHMFYSTVPLSISFWTTLKATDIVRVMVSKINASTGWEVTRSGSSYGIYLAAWNGSSPVGNIGAALPTNDISIGDFYHVVAVFDYPNNQLKLYFNGILANSGTYTGAPVNTTAHVNVGKRYDNVNSSYYNASMCQLRFFNRAVSDTEVTILYNEGKKRIVAIPTY